MEVVLVQLAHEAGEVAVLEMFGKYGFGESLILSQDFSEMTLRTASDRDHAIPRGRQNCRDHLPTAQRSSMMDPRAFYMPY